MECVSYRMWGAAKPKLMGSLAPARLTSLNVAGGIQCSDIQIGGTGGTGSSYALAKLVYNHIHLTADYDFSSSYRRICDNEITFPYEEKVIAVNPGRRRL